MDRRSCLVLALLTGGCADVDLADPVTADEVDRMQVAAAVGTGGYLRTTTSSITLADLVTTSVTSVTVPAGNWVVTGKVTAVNFGAADYTRCTVFSGGVQLDTSATLVGNAAAGFTGELGPSAATLTVQAVVKLAADTLVELKCQHDEIGTGVYLDPGASLRVFKSAGAKSATTAANVTLPDVGTATVTSVSRRNVQVAILGKATPVNFSDNDYVRGVLDAGGTQLDASATLLGVGASGPSGERGPSAATVELLALHDFTTRATLSLQFVHDFATTGIYVDPLASLITVPAPLGDVESSVVSTTLADDGSQTEIVALPLAAGNWALSGKATAVNFGAADYVRCTLLVDGVQLDASASLVGNAAPGFTGELGPSAATIGVQALVASTGIETYSLACGHDAFLSGEYVDPGATLLAIPVKGTLDIL